MFNSLWPIKIDAILTKNDDYYIAVLKILETLKPNNCVH